MSRFRIKYDGRELVLSHGRYIIGRSSSCDVVLDGGLVSRQHAKLQVDAEGLSVEDLGSRNGVRVNDRRIAEPVALEHGDQVLVGRQKLTILQEELVHRPEMLSTLPPPSVRDGDRFSTEVTQIAAITEQLSKREYEVFELLVHGFTQREIGERLNVSVKTIESHSRSIRHKLGCETRAELVRYAVVAGMLAPASSRTVSLDASASTDA